MGWREFRAWIREMNRSREREAGLDRTPPDSWAGYERDQFWARARKGHRQTRGA